MSINGIGAYVPPQVLPGNARPAGREGAATELPGAVQGTGTRGVGNTARAAHAVPMEAPEGTDPMLWGVLTSEERSFFARARAMGQVTYGPGNRSVAAGVPRGGRIDVRV